MKNKFAIIFMGVLVLIALYWTRYQVVEVHVTNGAGFYMINRFTGEITQVAYQKMYKVKPGNINEATENEAHMGNR